jgi:hypothetical protein
MRSQATLPDTMFPLGDANEFVSLRGRTEPLLGKNGECK